jgi:hypothetical protein
MIFLWDLYSNAGQNKAEEDPVLPPIAARIRDFMKQESLPIYTDHTQPRDKVYQAMDDMLRQLEQKRMDRNAFTDALQDLVQAVVAEQAGTRRQMNATLNPGDMAHSPLPQTPEDRALSLDDVRKTTELLKELFQGEIPAAIARDVSKLEHHSRVAQFLEQILSELRAHRDLKPGPLSPNQKDRALTAHAVSDTQTGHPTGASNHTSVEDLISNPTKHRSSSIMPGGGRSLGQEGDAGDQDMAQDFFPGIGDARAGGGKKPARELQGTKGVPFKEQGVSLVGERYNARVRALTSIGRSEKKDEKEIWRHYEQEIEEVLQKEEVPFNYREYIKTYFLSIGVGRKDHTDDGTR